MLKTRITAALASVALTAGIFSVVPTIPANSQTKADVELIVGFCSTAYSKFQQGDVKFLNDNMNKLDKETQAVVALACVAYGTGFEDGVNKQKARTRA